MASSDDQSRRVNGVYYTPRELSLRLVELFERDRVPTSILDPACGDGSLLSAAKEVFSRRNRGQKLNLYGCDVAPDLLELRRLHPKNIWVENFLELNIDKRFDLILMNPPYVRHHEIPRRNKQAYNTGVRETCALPKVSDLWAYFIVRAVEVVNDGGSVAAILPWAFLQADYARILRSWLAERFADIEVMAISSRQFKDAEERIALVWLRSKGPSAQSITVRNVDSPYQDTPKCYLSWSEWLRSRVVTTNAGPVDGVLSLFSDNGFVQFREVADTRIGTVTGADSFFIADKKTAFAMGLMEKDFQKIVSSLRNLRGFCLNGDCPDKVLMNFPSKPEMSQLVEYIEKGREKGIDQRSHCLRRSPWYTIPRLDPPDALFPYRASHTPYLVLNSQRYLCTNSVHAINWRKLSKKQIEWVQVALLSAPGQLSLEAHAKTYGSGVLKIEPSALGSALVTTDGDRLPRKLYKQMDALLVSNKRDEASAIATDIIQNSCGIDSKTLKVCKSVLRELKLRRLATIPLPAIPRPLKHRGR